MLYALLRNGNLIGLFTDLSSCNRIIHGLVGNDLVDMEEVKVVSYYDNSITQDKTFKNNLIIDDSEDERESENFNSEVIEEFSDNNTTNDENEENDVNDMNDLNQVNSEEERIKQKKEAKNREKKSKINYNLQLLKQKKEKYEEKKRTYEVDLELYKKFKKIKIENNDFVIPELFEDKYQVFEVLDEQNKVNFNNFDNLYEKKPISNKWDGLFGGNGKERELLSISESDKNSSEDINEN